MHECPLCGSQTIICRHCGWTWNPRDPSNIPDTCPRCRNDWRKPFKWSVKSKYQSGTVNAKDFMSWEKFLEKKPHKSKRLTDAEEAEISV